ncbi:helix-turn-helix domain-containing protein [Candidatus Latescibacterota bacterium]
MAKTRRPDAKQEALRQQGCLHPHPERVTDPLFVGTDFFDARDAVQVKYEMVRRVQAEEQPVGQTAGAFGFSRPSFYQAQAALEREGLQGLVPKKKGPRRAHKLNVEVMAFLQDELAQEPKLRSADLAARVRERFQVQVHPRSIERALARVKKKRA